MDRSPQDRKGQEEIQACQQRSLHFQDVLARGLCYLGIEKSIGCSQVRSTQTEGEDCMDNMDNTFSETIVVLWILWISEN